MEDMHVLPLSLRPDPSEVEMKYSCFQCCIQRQNEKHLNYITWGKLLQFKSVIVLECMLLNYSILWNPRSHDAVVSYTAACVFTIPLVSHWFKWRSFRDSDALIPVSSA